MIKILTEVAARRLEVFDYSTDIRLSSTLLKHAKEDAVGMYAPIGEKENFASHMGDEFTLNIFGIVWRVHNMAYRQDSNDEDVEEVLYQMYKAATMTMEEITKEVNEVRRNKK